MSPRRLAAALHACDRLPWGPRRLRLESAIMRARQRLAADLAHVSALTFGSGRNVSHAHGSK